MRKLKRKYLVIFLITIILIIGLVLFLIFNNKVSAGKVVDGKVEYSDKIKIASKSSTKVIEIKSIDEKKLDTIIITSEKLKAIKDKDELYYSPLKDYIKKDGVSKRDIYNVNKAIELKIVKEDDTFVKFLYKVSGFKNEKQFIKFCEDAFELMDK